MLALFLLASGCQAEEHDPEISAVHAAFTGAVRAGDSNKLFEMAPERLRQSVTELHVDALEALAGVRKRYPQHEKDVAIEALAADLVEGVADDRALFASLLDFDALPSGADVEAGLAITSITRTEDEATVNTLAGEVFRYVKEDDQWRSATLLAQFERYPSAKRLRANIKTAQQNLGTWTRATTETTDTAKPVGAYNVLAAAVQRGARVTVFENLDAASVKHLDAGYALIKQLQKALEKRYPRAKARRAYLDTRKLAWIERVSDPKSLFAEMWDARLFEKDLSVPPDGKVLGSEPAGKGLEEVRVKDGEEVSKILFRYGIDRTWKLAHLEPALQREAVRRLEAELRAVPGK